jgi:hypothetical protein
MGCSVWTVYFLIFVYAFVTFAAHVQERASVAISTQHFFASFGAFQDARNCLIRLCNMHVYTRASVLATLLADDKLVEHWDVMQPVPTQTATVCSKRDLPRGQSVYP